MPSSPSHDTDRKLNHWADWLVCGRDRGATEAQIRRTRRFLTQVRDRVLREAKLQPGQWVVDLGAGTGLLALEARRRIKRSGYVLALDVSTDALSECWRQAEPAENVAPVACVVGDALHLPFASQSVDVVVTRSVLIYLADKQAGVQELYRILKPGGCVSIFEPVNEVGERAAQQVSASGRYDELQPEWGQIWKYYEAHRQDWYGTLVGWDERDLVEWFTAAGFSRVKMSYEFMSGVQPKRPKKADIAALFLGRPNPNTPSYEEVARKVLGERANGYLERYARFLLSRDGARTASASVFLTAKR